MLHRCALVVVMCCSSACVIDRWHNYDRPARFETAVNARHVEPASRPITPPLARTTTGTPTETDPETGGQAVSVAARFTMRTAWHTYFGAEVEGGVFAREGSNLAGGYGVAGTRRSIGRSVALSAEIAGGWRGVRDSLTAPDRSDYVLEPRVRGEMWLGSQISLGATAGADLGMNGAWVAGVYLGVHSLAYGGDRD